MNEFYRGVLFTTGLFLFGKGMYELGRQKEKHENVKAWKRLAKDMEEICDKFKPNETNETQEEVE